VSSITAARATIPILETLLDAEAMTARLQSLLPGNGLRVLGVTLLDHKPGHRALMRYRTGGASGAADIYGKAYTDHRQALRAHALMLRVSAGGVEGGATEELSVPRPLALDRATGLVLYAPLIGPSLDAIASPRDRNAALRGTARWLATLHRSGLRLDRRLDVAHEARGAAAWAQLVGARHPEAALAAGRLARALNARAKDLCIDVSTPIHKDLHYQHVIVGDRVGVVDLDEARMGDASFDLAHFVANLDLLALRSGTVAGDRDRWREAFLGAYASATGWQADERFGWFAAYTCMKIAKQLATGRGPRPRPVGSARVSQIAPILDAGLRWLAR
jgi:hypothetical protein